MSSVSALNKLRSLLLGRSVRSIGCSLFSSAEARKPNEVTKKPKKPFVPRITLISADNIDVTTLEDAQKMAKRRDLKLVKILDLDTKTHRPVYKLMTGTEYHQEDLKQREQKKNERLSGNTVKGEKLLIVNCNIAAHDLNVQVMKIIKWIEKRYEVRVVVNGDPEKAENVYRFIDNGAENVGKLVQKRQKGNDLKFQILPHKRDLSTGNDSGKKS